MQFLLILMKLFYLHKIETYISKKSTLKFVFLDVNHKISPVKFSFLYLIRQDLTGC
ncbi:hypothetical protein CF65_02798 [Aggregatibacter actinomycetemcomitans HK1651]|nr:hypothetical protein CF65_02798 [Aggregatibacter actinomycetemcomitans HK1651]